MAVSSATLARIPNKVTAVATTVSGGASIYYLGTDVGDVYSYNDSTKVVTKIGTINAKIASMTLYSGALFIGTEGGALHSMTKS